MIIPIKTDTYNFYVVILNLMDKFPPIKGLTSMEINVLAEVMYQHYRHKMVDVKKRHLIVFSTGNRIEMQNRLEITRDSLNDYFSRLRRKKILSKDNRLLPFLNIIPDKNYELNIKFTINE